MSKKASKNIKNTKSKLPNSKLTKNKLTKNKLTKIDDIETVVQKILGDPYGYANRTSITELVDILKILSYHYYNTQEELVPDEIYDVLRDVLQQRDKNNPFLEEVGAPISKDKVALPYPMASLDKIKPDTDALKKWIKKYTGPYVISDKLDGVSGLLFNDENGKLSLYTRGDGQRGQNITYLINYVINREPFNRLPHNVAVRGELIISKNNFKKINQDFKNARNAVAGLVNSKNYSIDVARLTDFVAYSVINPRYKKTDEMKKLKEWGFIVSEFRITKNLDNQDLSEYLVKRRDTSKYEIDGLVVVDSSKVYKVTNNNPDYSFAFKKVLTDQVTEATVLDVEWNVSKHGYLKPRVRIEPVTLVGVEITYATAFNAKYVVDNNLGPGAIIKLVRSGDVIPHILEVLKPASNGKPKLPDIPHKWNKTGIDLVVKDIHGDASDNIKIKRITYFFKTIGVKNLSEGIITKLVDNGYDTIFKILKADKDDLDNIDGLGMRMIDKIYDNINTAFKNITLQKLMGASSIFGRGFGVRKSKLIVDAYPNIMSIKWNPDELKEKIIELDGFDEITASQFVDNFPAFKDFYEKLANIINLKHINKKLMKQKSNDIFYNEKIVFTGFRDKDLEQFIEDNGGKVSSSVSGNTTLVVYVDSGKKSSKILKAKKLGVKVMTKDEFIRKYK